MQSWTTEEIENLPALTHYTFRKYETTDYPLGTLVKANDIHNEISYEDFNNFYYKYNVL